MKQPGLRFRAPGSPLALGELLARALPDAGEASAAIARGDVCVEGRVHRDARGAVPAGSRVEVLGVPSEESGGGDAPDRLRALVLAPPWPAGRIVLPSGELRFEIRETRGAIAELSLDWHASAEGAGGADRVAVAEVLDGLAALGHPVIGDVRRGGVLAAGGLRLSAVAGSGEEPALPLLRALSALPASPALPTFPESEWWPGEALLRGRSPRAGGEPPALTISRESARILERGHPWVLRDDDSDDPARFRAGALVRLVATDGRDAGLGLVDGENDRVARRWAGPGERAGGGAAPVLIKPDIPICALEIREPSFKDAITLLERCSDDSTETAVH